MFLGLALSLLFLAGPCAAVTATFDQSGINLNNYMSASWPLFTVVNASGEPNGTIKPASGTNYIEAQTASNGQNAGYYPANGSLILDQYYLYGHVTDFYLACYTPIAFEPSSAPCNVTMFATCADQNGALHSFELFQQYTRSDNQMDHFDLTGFYNFYAGQGWFSGNGSTARCQRYDFHAITASPPSPGTNPLPIGFMLDSVSYTLGP